jgi:muramoyltetrapeptide carboxypeptidase LdcA involved in peptidoglycan recycling
MTEYKKPNKLKSGDTVAVLSPSWAGPSVFPLVYENGLKVLKEWGLKIKEYPMTRASGNSSLKNAELRAKDINDAFADKDVKAIFVSIGGDDSIRILPFINEDIIKTNPKIFIGYSDTTTMLTYFNQLGLITFNGPSIMAGFSQSESLPKEFIKHAYEILFNSFSTYEYPVFSKYCDGYVDWSIDENLGKTEVLREDGGLRTIQGSGIARGQLFGGCMEALEFMKGTRFYPDKIFWKNKILFLETSEEKTSIASIKRILRNYGVQGIFNEINGIIFGRARDYSDEEKKDLDSAIKEIISIEFDRPNLSIVTNAEFGHTDPQIILPNGILIEINLEEQRLKLLESCTV